MYTYIYSLCSSRKKPILPHRRNFLGVGVSGKPNNNISIWASLKTGLGRVVENLIKLTQEKIEF